MDPPSSQGTKLPRADLETRANAMLEASLSHGDLPASIGSSQLSMSTIINSSVASTVRSKDAILTPSASVSALTSSVGAASDPPPPYSSKDSIDVAAHDRYKRFDVEKTKRDLKVEDIRARKDMPKHDTSELFKEAASTDVLFLLDITSSMQPYIDSVKDQVRTIMSDLEDVFVGEAIVRIAVVGYRDHGDACKLEFLDFTEDAESVRAFVSSLKAYGGKDTPEDVLGALDKAISASWSQQNRCLVHIADSPPHGRNLHDLEKSQDDYYEPQSQPHGLTFEPIILKLIKINIHYAFLRIMARTDRMALEFSKIYGKSNSCLHTTNKYHGVLSTAKTDSMSTVVPFQPRFEELLLGCTLSALRDLVVTSVTQSFSRTAGRVSKLHEDVADLKKSTSPNRALSSIREDGEHAHRNKAAGSARSNGHPSLDTHPPSWDSPSWLDKTLGAEGLCTATAVHNAETLDEMIAGDENIKFTALSLAIRHRSTPFGEGAMRRAYYARTNASSNRFVIKKAKRSGYGRPEVVEDMRMQALCKAFALEFNGLLDIQPPLDFIVNSCLWDESGPTVGHGCMSLEPYISGEYVKYNSNFGYVMEGSTAGSFCEIAQAFTHFTFERSHGHIMVNDLQGVGRLFTDPAVQTKDPERFIFNRTNLHDASMKCFFATHVCNSFCQTLNLKSKREMFKDGKFEFRTQWPTMEPTICCSNKLCRSIIRVSSSRESDAFTGHRWCENCWPQLQEFTKRGVCVEGGRSHEFEVSEFFYESQGRPVPRECAIHRARSEALSAPSGLGASAWQRMRARGSRSTINSAVW